MSGFAENRHIHLQGNNILTITGILVYTYSRRVSAGVCGSDDDKVREGELCDGAEQLSITNGRKV